LPRLATPEATLEATLQATQEATLEELPKANRIRLVRHLVYD